MAKKKKRGGWWRENRGRPSAFELTPSEANVYLLMQEDLNIEQIAEILGKTSRNIQRIKTSVVDKVRTEVAFQATKGGPEVKSTLKGAHGRKTARPGSQIVKS